MDNTNGDHQNKPIKRACTQCRQQKAKCDSHLNPNNPCTRCRKLNLTCLISDSFKRLHKRERLSELEQDVEVLRKRLRTSESADTRSPVSLYHASVPVPVLSTPIPSGTVAPAYSTPNNGLRCLTPDHDDAVDAELDSEPTTARELNGVPVTAHEIDQLFQIYFRDYSPSMPVLDPRLSPNSYYARSPFLFWTIVSVACRIFPPNPALFSSLSQAVVDLAFMSINSSLKPVYSIQGLLLILTWPSLRDPTKLDTSYPLAGLLIHRAMQIGLHNPRASHEYYFLRERWSRLSESEYAARSNLWAMCVLVYQRICTTKGHIPNRLYVSSEVPSETLDVRLQLRCHDIVTRCTASVAENGLRDMTSDQKRALDIILRAFEDQLESVQVDIAPTVVSAHDRQQPFTGLALMNKITICASRLNMQVFHLYKESTATFDGPLAKLLATACVTIDNIEELCRTPGFPPSPPQYVVYTLLLAACSLLRILKMSPSGNVDLERATTHLALSISLVKNMSLYHNDVCSKSGRVLAQLWNDPKTFQRADGSRDITIRVQNRLALGPVLDIIWRWYDMKDTQQPKQTRTTNGRGHEHAAQQDESVPRPAEMHLPIISENIQPDLFDDQMFANFDWTLGDDFFSL